MTQGAVVYEVKNNITGQVYIGVTVDFERRKAEHFSLEYWAGSPGKQLYKNMADYGSRNFTMRILSRHQNESSAYKTEMELIKANILSLNGDEVLNERIGTNRINHRTPVVAYELRKDNSFDIESVMFFASRSEASKVLGVPQPTISWAILKKHGRVMNYLFANDIDTIIGLVHEEYWIPPENLNGRKSTIQPRLSKFLAASTAKELKLSDVQKILGFKHRSFVDFKSRPDTPTFFREYGYELNGTGRKLIKIESD